MKLSLSLSLSLSPSLSLSFSLCLYLSEFFNIALFTRCDPSVIFPGFPFSVAVVCNSFLLTHAYVHTSSSAPFADLTIGTARPLTMTTYNKQQRVVGEI